MSKQEIRTWLVERIAAELNTPAAKVNVKKPFVEYGIDSAAAVGVVADLEDHLGTPLDPNLFYEYPTIEDLVDYLDGRPAVADGSEGRAQETGA